MKKRPNQGWELWIKVNKYLSVPNSQPDDDILRPKYFRIIYI